jgi:hypothetical protein
MLLADLFVLLYGGYEEKKNFRITQVSEQHVK